MKTARAILPNMRSLVAALLLASLAGCASNTTFVYKPSAPVAGVRKLPIKLAVLPFQDGTENFTKRVHPRPPPSKNTYMYNLAKVGIGGQITALTPDLWAKGFADDLTASGAFRSVRFIYGPEEMVDEDFCIEGAVEKANATESRDRVSEYAVVFRAWRRTDKKPVWEKSVTRAPGTTDIQPGGGLPSRSRVDNAHAVTNRAMQGIYAEAREDLVRALASVSEPRGETDGRPAAATPAPPPPDSVDETIEGILKGK